MKRILLVFLVAFSSYYGDAQELQKIPNCPSNEIYDLHIDKKGFIWIAHNSGISRYDGISFTSFFNPDQTSLAMTDIVEDDYGRIWCHNFNSQIFYIQNEKMYALKEYDFRGESNFSRMILYEGELVVTTKKGLFICNTKTLKCGYVSISDHFKLAPEEKSYGTFDVCFICNTILAQGYRHVWYVYKKNEELRPIDASSIRLGLGALSLVKLEPRTAGDTAFLIDNTDRFLYKLTIKNNALIPVAKVPVKNKINTISVLGNKTWINTIINSFAIDNSDSIIHNNITSVVVDAGGNKWIASLTNGLLVSYKSKGWRNILPPALASDDYIKRLKRSGDNLVMCSEYGKVFLSTSPSHDSFSMLSTIPPKYGNPENIELVYNDQFLITMPKSIFLLNTTKHLVYAIDTLINTKSIALNGNTIYFTGGIQIFIKNIKDWGLYNTEKSFPFIIDDTLVYKDPGRKIEVLRKESRALAVIFDANTNSLLFSFTDGLQRIKDNKLTFILYDNQPLYVSSMAAYKNKIYAATLNKGLFIIEGMTVRKANPQTESIVNNILKIKLCNNHLWLFGAHSIGVLNTDNDEFLTNLYPFPAGVADINDVEEDSGNIYLAATNGLFTIPLAENNVIPKDDPILLYALVNNRDSIFRDNITLPANKNNLLFKLAIPVYKDAERLHFKYRLINGDVTVGEDSAWYYTQDAQREIQFNALQPGSYTLEIIAVKENEVISTKSLMYRFAINQPWYNTWWFYLVVMLSAISIVLGIYQYRLRQVFKVERIRRKISNDLHDDVGSTLSSINVYSQLAKSDRDNLEYISTIQSNAVSVINNLDDLVWNINPKNDALENVISRMRLFALPIFSEKGVECIFKVKANNPQLLIAPNVRADIYMLFKEMTNNVIKHAACTQCSIFIIQRDKQFRLTIKDNGRGFNIKNVNPHRNGLRIMCERAKDVKGSIKIRSMPGVGTEIRLTCRLK